MSDKITTAVERMADRIVGEPADKALDLAKAMRLMAESFNILTSTEYLVKQLDHKGPSQNTIEDFILGQEPIAGPKN